MRGRFFLFFAIFFCLLLKVPKVHADNANAFDISTDAKYDVSRDGDTNVTQNIILVNKTKYTYTPSYTISTGISDVKNLTAISSQKNLKTKVSTTPDGYKNIEIYFDKRIMGLGKNNAFTIHYNTNSIAKKGKYGWKIVIPGLGSPDSFKYYDITLAFSDDFGKPTVIFPLKSEASKNTYVFDKNSIGTSGIYLSFYETITITPPASSNKQVVLVSSREGGQGMPIKYMIILGMLISFGSLILAKVIYSTWSKYFQKRKL
ncbi:MAG TPA: hypothetical protein VG965_02060 [Patescibacteria group bacterium]|nr:hypothetical protein [Patescibacteria group bacterium]